MIILGTVKLWDYVDAVCLRTIDLAPASDAKTDPPAVKNLLFSSAFPDSFLYVRDVETSKGTAKSGQCEINNQLAFHSRMCSRTLMGGAPSISPWKEEGRCTPSSF